MNTKRKPRYSREQKLSTITILQSNTCPCCGKEKEENYYLCSKCRDSVEEIPELKKLEIASNRHYEAVQAIIKKAKVRTLFRTT